MAKQTFTTGQVLNASALTSLQQTAMGGGSTTAKTSSYVLLAADAGTVVQMNSSSATTITVNQSLFAQGDSVQIQNVGSGVCTVSAGTATVSTSATLALKQYDAGTLYFNTTSAAFFFAVDAADGMANPLTTTGDIIYSSSGSTAARLGIGSGSQVLTVSGGIPAWSTPTSGLTLITRQSFSSVATTTTTFDSVFSSTFTQYLIRFESMSAATAANDLYMQMRTVGTTYSGLNYMWAQSVMNNNATAANFAQGSQSQWVLANEVGNSARPSMGELSIGKVGNASEKPVYNGKYYDAEAQSGTNNSGYLEQSNTYTGFILSSSSSNITGTVSVYGLAKS